MASRLRKGAIDELPTSPVLQFAALLPAVLAWEPAPLAALDQGIGDATLIRLMARMTTGDGVALAELHGATARSVFRTVDRILRNWHDSEEVVGDVYREAWQNAHRYLASRATPLAWLIVIAKSRALDRHRHRARHDGHESRTGIVEDSHRSWTTGRDRGEEQAMLAQALHVLSLRSRVLIELYYFEGLTGQQISDREGMPLGTVKANIRRGLSKMRKHMDAPAAA